MDTALQTMIANMPEKTGRSLDEWKKVLQRKSFAKHSEAVNFLKQEHQVTHGFANTIVTISKEETVEGEDLVKAQYMGKENLLPIYTLLIDFVHSLGKDVTIAPKKTTVSIIRKRQFLLIKPATKTRIDLGLKLKDTDLQGRLEASGPFGTMCTHRIQLTGIEEIDEEVNGWIKKAYEQSV